MLRLQKRELESDFSEMESGLRRVESETADGQEEFRGARELKLRRAIREEFSTRLKQG